MVCLRNKVVYCRAREEINKANKNLRKSACGSKYYPYICKHNNLLTMEIAKVLTQINKMGGGKKSYLIGVLRCYS